MTKVWSREESEEAAIAITKRIFSTENPHNPSVCDCDLIGGDDECQIQPPFQSEYEQLNETAITLQCSLTAAEKELKVAVEHLRHLVTQRIFHPERERLITEFLNRQEGR